MSQYDATIAITTHNRKEVLRNAVASCFDQSLGERLQILVVDDGSSDGTADMIRDEFGSRTNLKFDRVEKAMGLIAQRSRFADLVDSSVIVSIDDDAVLPSPRTVEQTLEELQDPRVGAVAIPYIDVLKDPDRVVQRAPDRSSVWVAPHFRGTAHALKVDLFKAIGRYRGQLWRQLEESDYCARMLHRGYVVRLGDADPIHHLESPKRSRPEIDYYNARNILWITWWNAPMPYLPLQAAASTVNLLKYAVRNRRLAPTLRGLAAGLAGALGPERRHRDPVSRAAFHATYWLRRRGPCRIEDLTRRFPLGPDAVHRPD